MADKEKRFFVIVTNIVGLSPVQFSSAHDEVARWTNAVEAAAQAERSGKAWCRTITFEDESGPSFAYLLTAIVAVLEGAPKNPEEKK